MKRMFGVRLVIVEREKEREYTKDKVSEAIKKSDRSLGRMIEKNNLFLSLNRKYEIN